MPGFFLTSYGPTRIIRILFSLASSIALILLAAVFLFQFVPHPREGSPRVPQQYQVMIWVESSTYAVLQPLKKAIPTHFTYKAFREGKRVTLDVDLSALVAFFVLLIVRSPLRAGLERIERYAERRVKPRAIRERWEPPRFKPPSVPTQDQIFRREGSHLPSEERGEGGKDKVSTRAALMTEISKAKRLLEATKKQLAFLAADVVKSTQMKEGEDEVAIGTSFMGYKNFIESIVGRNGVWKQAWTPDGFMAAFPNLGQAISAGRDILLQLKEFNKNQNQLRTPFTLRLGVHGGELYFDESDKIEEVSDHVIDVTGHLQKEANINALWTTLLDIEILGEKGRFRQIGKEVGNYPVFEWSPEGCLGEVLKRDGLISEEQLNEAIKEQERSARLLGEILIERGFLGEEDLLRALGKQLRVATVRVDPNKVEADVLRRLPGELAEKLMIFPLSFRDGVLEIVSDSLIEVPLIRKLEDWLGLKINQEAIASRTSIRSAIEQGYRRLGEAEKD